MRLINFYKVIKFFNFIEAGMTFMENYGIVRLMMNTQIKLIYNKLWKLLIDKGWSTKLKEEAKISSFTMAKLTNCGNGTTNILVKIYEVLDGKV